MATKEQSTSIVQLDGTFDDEDGAAEAATELLEDKRPAGDIEQVAAELWRCKEKRLKRGPTGFRRLRQQPYELPVRVVRKQKSISEVFEEVVLSTPAVALSQLQRAVRASKAGGSREDWEPRLRERWAM